VHLQYRERDSLVAEWERRRDALIEVEDELLDESLSEKEARRLERRANRLLAEMEEIRIDIRVFERLNSLDRWTPPRED
jgi:TPP-dependent pyruvate/acetoin dehydrogenase alpha subunit